MCATPRFGLRAEAGFLFANLQFAKERLLLEANQIVGLQYSASYTLYWDDRDSLKVPARGQNSRLDISEEHTVRTR